MDCQEERMLKSRFKALYPKYRLLCVQLNGFEHKVFFDSGYKDSQIEVEGYSGYMPKVEWPDRAQQLLSVYPHFCYQNNAKEIVFVKPNER